MHIVLYNACENSQPFRICAVKGRQQTVSTMDSDIAVKTRQKMEGMHSPVDPKSSARMILLDPFQNQHFKPYERQFAVKYLLKNIFRSYFQLSCSDIRLKQMS